MTKQVLHAPYVLRILDRAKSSCSTTKLVQIARASILRWDRARRDPKHCGNLVDCEKKRISHGDHDDEGVAKFA